MITRICRATCVSVLVVAGLLIACGHLEAKEYPPTPINTNATAASPTVIDVLWYLATCPDDQARFEIEETVKGARQSPADEANLSQSNRQNTGAGDCRDRVYGISREPDAWARLRQQVRRRRAAATVSFVVNNKRLCCTASERHQ